MIKMFSRKMAAAILIVLMCMVMVPLASGDKVRADGPNMQYYSRLDIHETETIQIQEGEVFDYTMKLYPMYSMKYQFTVKDLYFFGIQDINLALYDSKGKLITSTKEKELKVDLTNDPEGYYIVVTSRGCCTVSFEYDYSLDAKVGGRSIASTFYGYKRSPLGMVRYIGYRALVGEEVTLGLDIGTLPSGMTLSYEWFLVDLSEGTKTSIGTKGQPLKVKNEGGSAIFYRCYIRSSDGEFWDELYIKVCTDYTLAYEDGTDLALAVRAYKPGEVRKINAPKEIYGSDTATITTDFRYYNDQNGTNFYNEQGSKILEDIPEKWDGTYFYYHHTINEADIKSLMYYFVFADGEGEKASVGNTYHIDYSIRTGGYSQAIYTITPDKDATYSFKASNAAGGFPSMFLFDKDRNLVTSVINNTLIEKNVTKDNMSFDVKADLKAGETYYIAVPTSEYGSFDLNISGGDTEKTFEDFVERLYVVALGRASEPDGKAHWCKVVGNGSYSGADCARFFLTSPEFNGRNLNDEEYLKVLYKTFFDRDASADPDGFNFWLGKIGEWGRSRVLEGFIDSTEWCNICADYGIRSGAMTAKATKASKNATAFATRLYTECLGREPEEGGLNFWSLSLTNQERTGTQAAKEFFYSPEFIGKELGNEEYVNRLYKTFMGREPEAEGKAYWLEQLGNGSMNRDQVFEFFSTCEEFTGICNSYAIAR